MLLSLLTRPTFSQFQNTKDIGKFYMAVLDRRAREFEVTKLQMYRRLGTSESYDFHCPGADKPTQMYLE